MIIVAGWIKVDPAARESYLDGCRAVLEQARAAAGCLDFSLTADLLEPWRINVFERWESDEDLARFRGSGPDEEQATQILDASVAKYRISAVEAP
ncbi:antibiotic biosynthesis monooxygenase [Phytohabitans flavus]|uniref:Antibiotic biosynthesis monooxygenase n=1 Tax=Phytohabitans flavus TaxID=1076124 RepID=A0A6F8Y6R9_9ACTN|nr:antibiotic biosynthesis monooxygenase family protein [Phytohabitans flavus]BCB81812.1 antibiotic biosynthesis monooxygenase [Phytohabitans flavus]